MCAERLHNVLHKSCNLSQSLFIIFLFHHVIKVPMDTTTCQIQISFTEAHSALKHKHCVHQTMHVLQPLPPFSQQNPVQILIPLV